MKIIYFNKFFLCDNVNNIIKLYNQEDKVWQHPLLLNYSYCTFCNDKPKSSYNINSISKFHLKVEPSLFLSEKKLEDLFFYGYKNKKCIHLEINGLIEDTNENVDMPFVEYNF